MKIGKWLVYYRGPFTLDLYGMSSLFTFDVSQYIKRIGPFGFIPWRKQ